MSGTGSEWAPRVERMTPTDLSLVVGATGLYDDPLSEPDARAYLQDPRNIFLMALDEGRPVGFLRGTELDQLHTPRKQMFLYEVAVAEGHRRRGAGRALVRALLQYCRDRGFEEAFVFTDPANREAVGLYRSTGAVTETPADRMFVYRLTDA